MLVGVNEIVPFVAERVPVDPVKVLPTIGIVETELVTDTAVDDRETLGVLSIVTFVEVRETLPATVTAVFVRETFTGFPTALLIVEAVPDRVTVPTVMLTKRYPLTSAKTG